MNILAIIILTFISFGAHADELNLKPATKEKNTQIMEEAPPGNTANNIANQGVVVGDIYVACKYYFSRVFSTRESIARKNICNGYFFGSAGMVLLLQHEGLKTGTCMPNDISTEEIIRSFIEWTDKNQDKMKLPAATTLLEIFRKNYPCGDFKPASAG
jgi:hypothetical protein